MHLRRALLLFALVLGLTALAASIAPAPRHDDPAATTTPLAGATPTQDASLAFRAGARSHARARRVDPGSHVVVAVSSSEAGQAGIPRLGLTAAVTPSAPARFDLVAPDAGRYDVTFTAAASDRAMRVGTLVSRARR